MIYYINQNEGKVIFTNRKEYFEEASIYTGTVKKNKYCIFSDPQKGRNFEYDPYIKVYNNFRQEKADKVVRVSMKTGAPLPTEHTNSGKDGGKGRLKFSKEVAKFLTDAMDKPYESNSRYPDDVKTVYDAIYRDVEDVCGRCIKYPVPNFMENVE